MPTAKKSVGKSTAGPVPPQLKPFQRGADPRRGHGPAKGAPNAGRPPDRIVELARQGLEAALPGIIEIAKGLATEKIVGPNGEETEFKRSAPASDRARCTETLGKVARMIGARIEVEHKGIKPLVVIVRPE